MARPEKEPTSADRKTIIAAARVGASHTTMSALVGVSRNTFSRWLKDYDDFEIEVSKAHAKALVVALTKLKAGKLASLAWLTRVCRDSHYLAIDNRPIQEQREINKELLEAIKQLRRDDG